MFSINGKGSKGKLRASGACNPANNRKLTFSRHHQTTGFIRATVAVKALFGHEHGAPRVNVVTASALKINDTKLTSKVKTFLIN